MTPSLFAEWVEVVAPTAAALTVLTIGLGQIWRTLTRPKSEPASLLCGALTEKTDRDARTSSSRAAMLIGGVVFAAFSSGLALWTLGDLAQGGGDIAAAYAAIADYFWVGITIFFPYAANQVATAFRPSTPPKMDGS